MKHKIFIGLMVIEAALLGIFYITGSLSAHKRQPALQAQRQLVENLMLTDLAIWTEATYTRHPSQADFFTPFQDFPAAIEHFPSGAIVASPLMTNFTPLLSGPNPVNGE